MYVYKIMQSILISCLTPYYLGNNSDLYRINSCVNVSLKSCDCLFESCDNATITRTRCPVWKIRNSECSNGDNFYTFQDIAILNDEGGHCLIDGELERRAYCDGERRAPFTDCNNCDEGNLTFKFFHDEYRIYLQC